MISIREQHYGLDVALYNEFTLADFKLLEEALLKRQSECVKPDLLLDLTELKDFTLDMALEEVKFMRAHENHVGRVALVVSDVWIKLAAHIAGLLSNTRTQYFDTAEEAQAWLESPVAAGT
ncbi:STAS/SEC14 domain-containing protein [Chromobacterium haemolyticum]|uniref:STAS/SEC14 domain-containing protein n=1 Tax=Chromobacterium fluminis TaxID=3044269 RepID=A0ABX0L8Y9_9NEIS|nr:STAS/SEC14 domain-containing protein [Chromobacterium haemolyticum]NHR05954.1 STAS/SEC14 domain-containing protein [Chromobacterium haemolyticum]OQS41597.1 STAS/SEC14 domain-containing protein [Chromobacterium haemolyticum]